MILFFNVRSYLLQQEGDQKSGFNNPDRGKFRSVCKSLLATSLRLGGKYKSHLIKKASILWKLCELAGTRTLGPYIKSVLLYQLSYQFIRYFRLFLYSLFQRSGPSRLNQYALPTELPIQVVFNFWIAKIRVLN